MSTQRKHYSAVFKVREALEALKGLKTVNELALAYGGIRADSMGINASPKRYLRFSRHDGQNTSTTTSIPSLAIPTNWTTQRRIELG